MIRFNCVWCCLLLIGVWIAIPLAQAQEKAPAVAIADPEPSVNGLPPDQLQAIDRWIEQTRQEWGVPGLSVAIVQNDEVVLSKGYGVRQAGSEAAVDGDTLYAIASNSKAFTAAALAILVDEGKLRWDDPVHRYLPWLRLSDPLASQDLRVRDLLCHRSGLGTFSGDLLWWGTPYSAREILQRSVQLKPENPFRGGYGYSNLMYLAAGEVVQAVSGQPWNTFVQSRILKPLRMERTRLSVNELSTIDNVATPHKTLVDKAMPSESKSVPIEWMNWDSMGAAGGIISSVNDMSQWLRLQLKTGQREDGEKIFSTDRAYEMWQPQTIIPISKSRSQRFPSTHFRAYGLGWSLADYQGVKLVGHSGGYDGMYSEVLMVPERNLGIVVLTNSMTPIGNAIAYAIVDRAIGAPDRNWSQENLDQFRKSRVEFQERITKATSPVAEGTQPSHPLSSYSGTFQCPMYGRAAIELVDESCASSSCHTKH
jgi:CubicO group peptidase (beta-lactamase class C family)